MFIRATLRSLGMFGLLLAFAFFGTLLWVAVTYEIVSLSNFPLIIDLVLVIFSGVLATGMSWSHIRRRISGQYDVDDIDN
jgi:TRAP-type C4-dicarboxylate transport system permease small subunit